MKIDCSRSLCLFSGVVMGRKLLSEVVFLFNKKEKKEEFIQIPFVRKILGDVEYMKVTQLILLDSNTKYLSEHYLDHTSREGLILDLDVLQEYDLEDIYQYIFTSEIRDEYIRKYGTEYFRFESSFKVHNISLQDQGDIKEQQLDDASFRIMIIQLKSFMGSQLQRATSLILAQDFSLQEIAAELTFQAQQAKKFMSAVKENDIKYKQNVINLCFSLIRAGLDMVNASEIVDICLMLADLAQSSEDIQAKLVDVVDNMQDIVAYDNHRALVDSEMELVSMSNPQDIDRKWVFYRASVYRKSFEAIQLLWNECINSDNFMRCIIKQAARSQVNSKDDTMLEAAQVAKSYIDAILEPMQQQLDRISTVRNSVKSIAGGEYVQIYFRRMNLINYTLSHENSRSWVGRWLSKSIGHQLTKYFPAEVFQKKWSPIWCYRLCKKKVKYAGGKISTREYFERKNRAELVLGQVSNSKSKKSDLFGILEHVIPTYKDRLVDKLHNPNDSMVDEYDGRLLTVESEGSLSRGRYTFNRPTLTLFGNVNTAVSKIYLP